MQGFYTVAMLLVANVFMTFAWYGHLRLQGVRGFSSMPLIAVILLSWCVALPEYLLMIPANKMGYQGNGGPFSLVQLKVIQEVITLTVFAVFTTVLFRGESLHWNHLAAGVCLIAAVYLVFLK